MTGNLGCVIMRPMRLAVSFAVLLLGVACGSALVPIQSLQPDKLQGASDSITIVSARFGSNCKGPSDDVTALFRQACDGKWRCAVRSSRQLSAKQEAVNQAARETACGGALYTVDWICGEGTGKRSLRNGPGLRFRLSCPRPDAQGDEASAGVAVQPEAQPVAAPLATSGSNRDLAVRGRFLGTWAAGVADRTIVVGSQQTSTDQTGAFSLSDVPATYDLSVIEKDGARVSLFLGLSRRDPVVAHAEWQGGQPAGLRRGASISGRLAGVEFAKADGRLRATAQFFSPITGSLVRSAGMCVVPLADAGAIGCGFHWALTGVAGSSWPISLGIPAYSPRRDRPEPPIPVAASGLLVLEPHEDGPLLKQANLCLIPAKP